ncbi:3-dehydroquinate dehydratase [Catalinimonas alkaloidigena]|uniref:3-dehydroquinate dehydratase n=1 Tax=Catalinimonas alkaloidigena TaxID=1075417 RepID=A0A1G9HJ62_9BACT|nr:type II 3-dehydroquinate dehydratase [Catalinimonas alkaloidigena]SDL12784.1 3-dehydroquinate dehydratase [Catalinimonas alkaloidigena]
MQILILNGPNLNLLGVREPGIYGSQSFEAYLEQLKASFSDVQIAYFQSNHEGELIDKLHEVGFSFDGIILNAGGFTHTSVALTDAVAAIKTPVVEVHISNIFKREAFRHHSYLSPNCVGIISGLGMDGYRLALLYLLHAKTTTS